jgi:hypothetical protein
MLTRMKDSFMNDNYGLGKLDLLRNGKKGSSLAYVVPLSIALLGTIAYFAKDRFIH